MRVFSVAVGVLAVLVGGLLVGAPAGATSAGATVPDVSGAPAAVAVPVTGGAVGTDVTEPVLAQEPGPKLDPQTEADEENTKNKAIVGGAAAVLLLIVLYGRHVRAKRAKPKK